MSRRTHKPILSSVFLGFDNMEFKLGTHILSHIEKTNVPLFISFRQLRKRKKKPFEQISTVCIDSGGFSELSLFGKWTISQKEYILELQRLENLSLKFEWIAQQDWMCEDIMIQKTGLSIHDHQIKTVQNFDDLNSIEHEYQIVPVLQGKTLEDYWKCFELFESKGHDLRKIDTVGIGSICKRQNTNEIGDIVKSFHNEGVSIHGFGVKKQGIQKYGKYLKSCDSLAWSYKARFEKIKLDSCHHNAKNCANCLDYALKWRDSII